jgi:hypothetical protein
MFGFLKKHTVYVRVSKNKMDVRNLNTKKEVSRISTEKFSNDRLIIADFEQFEKFLRSLLYAVSETDKFLKPALNMLIQPIDDHIKEVSEVELRAYKDSAEHAGGVDIVVYDKQERLTDEQVIRLFNKS